MPANNIIFNAGIAYTDGVPTFDPGTVGSLRAIDASTLIEYEYDGANWNEITAGGGAWGTITGTLSDQTDLQAAFDAIQQSKWTDAGAHTYLTATGDDVGVGLSSAPTGRLTARGAGATSATNAFTAEKSTGVRILTVRNDGKVAIGSSAPAYELDVTGSINTPEASTTNFYRIGGWQVLYHDINRSNTYVGPSGRLAATGDNNVAIGDFNLTALTTGSNNYIIGNYSARKITTGRQNFVMGGGGAMGQMVSGIANFALGNGALANATTNDNVAIGDSAIASLTTGARAVGIGSNVMFYTTTGNDNVAIGYIALFNNITGDKNVAIGRSALENATTSNNVAIGDSAGDNLTTGDRCIVIGAGVDAPSATTANQLTIGNIIFGVGVDGTGTTVSSGRVGIRTNAPDASATLDITSTTGGVLFPRMTTTQRDAISSPADGLVLFNTTDTKLQVRAGAAWVNLH